MRRLSGTASLLLVIALGVACAAPAGAQPPKPPAGMDTYLFGILRRGDVKPPASPDEARSLQAAHRQNMTRMADAGLLVGAGPITDDGEIRGIFIFRADSRQKIDGMLREDPLIQSGRLVLDLLPWWGPEKIGERYFAKRNADPAAKDVMVSYQLAFLLAGPNRQAEQAEAKRIQEAHMAHIRRMAEAGKLVAAGPFVEEQRLRGIFVFKMDSLEEAKALAQQDPAVQAGRLVLDIHPWLVADGVLPPPNPAGGAK